MVQNPGHAGWQKPAVTASTRETIRLTISHARFFVVWDIVERGLPFSIVVVEAHDFTVYGKPNGAKFKKQNWLHVQQICFQGQGRFQSSSTKSIHVQPIFSQDQDI